MSIDIDHRLCCELESLLLEVFDFRKFPVRAAVHGRKQPHHAREPYANIREPNSAQISLHRPKRRSAQVQPHQRQALILNRFGNSVDGSEKAGVGGSTPSLATTFQSTCSESLDLS